jgi:hypothetical protein
VNDVQRQSEIEQRAQRHRANDVPAVDDGFRTFCFCGRHRLSEHGRAIMAVGHDANLHGVRESRSNQRNYRATDRDRVQTDTHFDIERPSNVSSS